MSYLGSVFHCARITLETGTPLSIATGHNDGIFDMSLVRDANGLPTIPSTSLAGVLRHLYWQHYGEAAMQALFGYQIKEKGEPSPLNVSWGMIQNSKGKAIQGLCLDKDYYALRNDLILNAALETQHSPVYRDRVKLNHRGVAEKTGKFERTMLAAGYRFSVELSLWSHNEKDSAWDNVLSLLHHPLFRLGGSTRAGMGKVRAVSIHTMTANLATAKGRQAFAALSMDMNHLTGFRCYFPEKKQKKQKKQEKSAAPFNDVITAILTLRPKNYWRIGQGEKATLGDDKPADMLPKLEQRLSWNKQNIAQPMMTQLLIPASSIKGALAHRIAFHANCHKGVWAEEHRIEDAEEYGEAVPDLFGTANDSTDNTTAKGMIGKVLLDDSYLPFSAEDLQLLMHNSIDRFSGNVRDHMLFSEEMVWQKTITIPLTINDYHSIDDKSCMALSAALVDLCEGRLAIGAGVSKGHGFCTGSLTWSDKGKWINQQETEAKA